MKNDITESSVKVVDLKEEEDQHEIQYTMAEMKQM